MTKNSFEQARKYALQRLEQDLSPRLFYHSLVHTRDDVVPATERLANRSKLSETDCKLVLTAAYFHDIGFTLLPDVDPRGNQHELLSAQMAQEILPTFGYRKSQVEAICKMILATRLPQSPATLLEEILADADLDSLGREDFWQRSQALRDENAAYGTIVSDAEWFMGQFNFLSSHKYFTAAARQLRGVQKQKNVEEIVRILKSLGVEVKYMFLV
jgi:uncharacterized protein